MEGDIIHISLDKIRQVFQSTPSAWRETVPLPTVITKAIISIHSLRMEGDQGLWHLRQCGHISIHSLRMEGDWNGNYAVYGKYISIHSLRMEGDDCHRFSFYNHRYFNPLPPHGGRRIRPPDRTQTIYFNPLPPHGGRQEEAEEVCKRG